MRHDSRVLLLYDTLQLDGGVRRAMNDNEAKVLICFLICCTVITCYLMHSCWANLPA